MVRLLFCVPQDRKAAGLQQSKRWREVPRDFEGKVEPVVNGFFGMAGFVMG